MQDQFSTLDVYLTAWISLSIKKAPELSCTSGKVAFSFPLGQDLAKAIDDYNAGKMIEANRYTFVIKNLKAQMFQLKNQN